jgi:carboxypeptidase C (cathepsin A)
MNSVQQNLVSPQSSELKDGNNKSLCREEKKNVQRKRYTTSETITVQKPGGALSKLTFSGEASWILLRYEDTPIAEIFYTYYKKENSGLPRPLTFVFNGGPGASSTYLHLGALGPWRVHFTDDGNPVSPPRSLIENHETWLDFTDLVFIDPIDTGFSRVIPEHRRDDGTGLKEKESKEKKENDKIDDNFLRVHKDLKSISEFIYRFLDQEKRWGESVYLCGESYGGFRAAKLAALLQEDKGINVSGAFLVSPALEFSNFNSSSYDVIRYIDQLPTMALTALHHGKLRIKNLNNIKAVEEKAEQFATNEYARLLILGDALPETELKSILTFTADLTGLPFEYVYAKHGRIQLMDYFRDLLQNERLTIGLYDTSMTAFNPFPEKEENHWGLRPDASFGGINSIFTEGINALFRKNFNVDTERDYIVCNTEVFRKWQNDNSKHYSDLEIGSVDDIRYAMALNPYLVVTVFHGCYDLVTPYFTSKRLSHHLRLPENQKERFQQYNLSGGHMFYTKKTSRELFLEKALSLYKAPK